jgi:hypothetical protein
VHNNSRQCWERKKLSSVTSTKTHKKHNAKVLERKLKKEHSETQSVKKIKM